MKRAVTLGAIFVLAAGPLAAQSSVQSSTASQMVAGTWTVSVVNRSNPVILDLKLEGATVTGVFGGSRVQGEFKDRSLTFADPASWTAWLAGTIGRDTAPDMYQTVAFARLNESGTLSGWSDVFIRGYGPQAIKRVAWTATRSSGK